MDKVRDGILKGMSVCNPVEVDKDYLLFTVKYAAEKGFDHLQIIGPIHDGVKGNVDGMTFYRKYSQFNNEKCSAYVEQAMNAVNAGCEQAMKYGIRTYVWHHELELPLDFGRVYPEVTNDCGDIEVTHPLVRDFLENKIEDFFYAYPNIDGIVLTLHETKIPLLRLKNQKLGKVERVKYVTKILYDTCCSLGKELIVRPFASLEEDYVMMEQAYEEISTEMTIMDKWTQFDWSLSLPSNAFYSKIKRNPLLVEADIFGEFFGKGRLPLMLKDHLAEKFAYCEQFSPKGYVARVDRAGENPFGDVNEVNIVIAHAHLNNKNIDCEIDRFFRNKYPLSADEVRRVMEQTEDILRKTIYIKGYYYSELSFFPTLNHCKNHFYFEMMREHCDIASDEWYIPRDWRQEDPKEFLAEKEEAVCKAAKLYDSVTALEGRVDKTEYEKLRVKFCNLKLVTEIWMRLTIILMDYVRYFETRDKAFEKALEEDIGILLEKNNEGNELLGDKFYCRNAVEMVGTGADIEDFVKELRESFRLEKNAVESIEQECNVLDYVICGGAMEGHRLQKEVNFSDTQIRSGALCRIPGNYRGKQWSMINAHGWFSYEVRVKPNARNTIRILMEGAEEELNVRICIGEKAYTVCEKNAGRKEYCFPYTEENGADSVRIRFDKISGYTPCIFEMKVVADESYPSVRRLQESL